MYANPRSLASRSRIRSVAIRSIFRTVIVLALAAVAYMFRNNFAVFLSLVGSVACSAVLILLPSLMHLKLVSLWSMAWFVDCIFVVIGILAPIAGVIGALH